MINKVENIGTLNYLRAITFGKGFRVRYIAQDDQEFDNSYLLTIHDKFLILTEMRDGKRCPVLIKKWKKMPKLVITATGMPETVRWKDDDGWVWMLFIDRRLGSSLSAEDEHGKKILVIHF
jgi:hypothetical protein